MSAEKTTKKVDFFNELITLIIFYELIQCEKKKLQNKYLESDISPLVELGQIKL